MGSVFSGEFIEDSTNALNNDSQRQVEQTRVVCTLDRKLAIIKKKKTEIPYHFDNCENSSLQYDAIVILSES